MQNSFKFITTFLIFSLLANFVFSQDKIIDQIVAQVGSNIILKSDIENMYLQNQAQGITSDGDMKCEILENLLIEKLLVEEAELDTNIIVTENQINQQMDMRIQYFTQNLGSEKAVEDYFKKPIIKLKSELKDVIRNEILSGQMRSTIIKDVKVTPSEVRYYYRNMDEDDKPKINTQFEYSQIVISPRIDEKEENRIKDQLREFKRRVEEDGDNFAMLAVLYSEDPTAAANGGDLGYFGRAQMDPAFSAAAFNLKPGKISNVVKTEFGFHIIQMMDRKGEKVKARHILLKPKVKIEVKEKAIVLLDSMATEIRKDNDFTFEIAAMRFSMDKDTRNSGGLVVNPMTMSSKFEPAQLNPSVSKILTDLQINEISDPFILKDERKGESIVIVKLKSKTEAHTANLQEDYQIVSQLFDERKKEETVEKWIGERQAKTYIRIDPTYQNCDFKFKNWIK